MPLDTISLSLPRKEVEIPWWAHGSFGVTPAIDLSGTTDYAAGALLPHAGTGAIYLKEISTFGIVAPLMVVTGTMHVAWRIPQDCDPTYFLGVYVNYTTGSSTTADTIDWKVFCDMKVGETAAIVAATTALDTTIAQDTITGAYHMQSTSLGKKNAGFATRANIIQPYGVWACLTTELDAKAAGLTEDIFFQGLRLTYSPKINNFRGHAQDPGEFTE